MPGPFDTDLELLMVTALRHVAVLPPMASVHLSGAVAALTDPLAPPALTGAPTDPDRPDAVDATADLTAVLRGLRRRLSNPAGRTDNVREIIAAGLAARELGLALAALDAADPEPAPAPAESVPAARAGR